MYSLLSVSLRLGMVPISPQEQKHYVPAARQSLISSFPNDVIDSGSMMIEILTSISLPSSKQLHETRLAALECHPPFHDSDVLLNSNQGMKATLLLFRVHLENLLKHSSRTLLAIAHHCSVAHALP